MGTLAEIARQCEVSEAYLSQIKNKSKESKTGTPRTMGDKIARKIERGLGLDFGWMDADHSNELREATLAAMAEIESMLNACEIPIIELKYLLDIYQEKFSPEQIGFGKTHSTLTHSRKTFAAYIHDRAMEPEFSNGDVLIIDFEVEPQAGDLVVAYVKPDLIFFRKYKPKTLGLKKTADFSLVPINQDYPGIHSNEHSIKIIGVMIEHRRLRKAS